MQIAHNPPFRSGATGRLPEYFHHHIDELEVLTPAHQQQLLAAVARGTQAAHRLAEGGVSDAERRALLADVRTADRARDRLVKANMRLVIWCVNRWGRRWKHSGRDDLIQEGARGLAHAIAKFDAAHGASLTTYATWWIRQAISRAGMTDTLVHIPVHVHGVSETGSLLRRAAERFDRIDSLDVLLAHTSTDDENRDELRLVRRRSISPYVDDRCDEVDASLTVEHVLCHLSEREALILRKRHGIQGDQRTLEEIGRELNLTRERVRQIEAKALEKCRRLLLAV